MPAKTKEQEIEEAVSGKAVVEKVEEKPTDSAEEIAMLKAQLEEMKDFMKGLVPAVEQKKQSKSNVLDKKRPYMTHRNVGGFYYEQDGKKFNGKGDFVEIIK